MKTDYLPGEDTAIVFQVLGILEAIGGAFMIIAFLSSLHDARNPSMYYQSASAGITWQIYLAVSISLFLNCLGCFAIAAIIEAINANTRELQKP